MRGCAPARAPALAGVFRIFGVHRRSPPPAITEKPVTQFARRLRTPEERVGMLSNASLPPPARAVVPEESILARALAQRDEAAFAHVLDLYYPAMLRLAQMHVRSRATADEVIQETWLAALNGFARFEGRSAIKTWLFRILRNIARATARREARSSAFSDLAGADEAASRDAVDLDVPVALWTRGSDPERDVLAEELLDRVQAAIRRLPPRQQEVLILRDVEGWAATDVCNVLGLSDTNQRVILHRARDRVRAELRDYVEDHDGCQAEQHSLR